MSKRSISLPNKETNIDWEKCSICQSGDQTGKDLKCPDKRESVGYSTFVMNVEKFNALVDVELQFDLASIDEGEGPERTLKQRKAKWHDRCRIKYSKTKIQRLEEKRQKQLAVQAECPGPSSSTTCSHKNDQTDTETARRSSRQAVSSTEDILQRNRSMCVFCSELEDDPTKLHKISDMQVQNKIALVADQINDTRIKAVLAMGDLMAQEIHYHRNCYVTYMRRKVIKINPLWTGMIV